MIKKFLSNIRWLALSFDAYTYILLFFLVVYAIDSSCLAVDKLIITIPCLVLAGSLFAFNIHFVKNFGKEKD